MSSSIVAFHKGNSLFHRIDPVSKFFFVVAMSFLVIFNSDLRLQVVLVAIAAASALLLSGTAPKVYWSFGKVIIPFVLAVSIAFPFFYAGHMTSGSSAIAIHTPIKDLSWAALEFGALLALRFLALAFVGLLFAFTTHPDDIIQAVSRRGIDYRLVHAVVIGLVFIPVFATYAEEISIAQQMRDLGAHSNRFARWFVRLRHMMFAMLVLGLRKAQITATTLEIKGFGAARTKTFLRPLHEPLWGKIFGYLCLVTAIGFVILRLHPILESLSTSLMK